MGREIKRVSLDFSFPLGETWPGYLNPHYKDRRDCPDCHGDSMSPAGRLLNDLWYLSLYGDRVPAAILAGLSRRPPLPFPLLAFAARIEQAGVAWSKALEQRDVDALLKADRLWDFTRRPLNDQQRAECHPNGWTKKPNGCRPTAAEVNAWASRGMGHDAINAWACQSARAKSYRVATACRVCRGTGHVPDAALARRIRSWRETEPPAGDGWQLWQTVSEGGPVSPVFVRPEELARWLATGGHKWQQEPMDYDGALRWVCGPGWALSFVSGPGIGACPGIVAMAAIAGTLTPPAEPPPKERSTEVTP